jgi:hypothetical protein
MPRGPKDFPLGEGQAWAREKIPSADTVPSAEDWRRAVDWVEAQYPPAVFPPDSDSLDARSGTFARHVCRNIRKEARRIMEARPDA